MCATVPRVSPNLRTPINRQKAALQKVCYRLYARSTKGKCRPLLRVRNYHCIRFSCSKPCQLLLWERGVVTCMHAHTCACLCLHMSASPLMSVPVIRCFSGGSPELEDLRDIARPADANVSFINKHGCQTVSGGEVVVRVNCVAQRHVTAGDKHTIASSRSALRARKEANTSSHSHRNDTLESQRLHGTARRRHRALQEEQGAGAVAGAAPD